MEPFLLKLHISSVSVNITLAHVSQLKTFLTAALIHPFLHHSSTNLRLHQLRCPIMLVSNYRFTASSPCHHRHVLTSLSILPTNSIFSIVSNYRLVISLSLATTFLLRHRHNLTSINRWISSHTNFTYLPHSIP